MTENTLLNPFLLNDKVALITVRLNESRVIETYRCVRELQVRFRSFLFPLTRHSSTIVLSGGIGLATAKTFLAANVRGLLLVDQSQEYLDRTLLELSSDEQQRCQCFVADVSSEADNYAQRALELWGKLDIAVLNAGICNAPTSILDTDAKIWDKIMQVNGRGGAFHDSFATSPHSCRVLLQYF